ncbi:LacI family DNA-binding transcriptional regulator [Sphingomonas aracearum]|nr:substrate-binding domain-containing protein [Sphingomonas aracearum]
MAADRKIRETKSIRGGERPATIKDVALEAGVSVSSVSRALNGGANTSSGALDRILRAAKKLGFEPNPAAQTLRSRPTKTVGCILSDISNPIFAAIINAAEEELQAADYQMMIGSTRHDPHRELSFLSALRRRRPDGLLIMAGEDSHAEVVDMLNAFGAARVCIDRVLPGVPTVRADHRSGAVHATSYLIGLGHTRIALLMSSKTLLPGSERLAGYEEAHRAAGIAVDERLVRPHQIASHFAFSEFRQLLSMDDPPTAVITLGTRMLAGVLQAINSAGLRIPDDISVVSVGETDLACYATPAISTLTWDYAELGRVGARMLIDTLAGGAPQTNVVLPTQFITRASCAPPRPAATRRAG